MRIASQKTPGDKGSSPEKSDGKKFQIGFQADPVKCDSGWLDNVAASI